jgi:3-keto-L-gulonate-6-phosphate decarboxylase
MEAVSRLKAWSMGGFSAMEAPAGQVVPVNLIDVFKLAVGAYREAQAKKAARVGDKYGNNSTPVLSSSKDLYEPYIVADLKTIDRGADEVGMAAAAGASAAVAMGSAPVETLNTFIAACHEAGMDAMIDMMNVEYPTNILRALKKLPAVVIVHRGVDEERDNREKQIPYHEIKRIKGNFDILVAVAGGDTLREVQRSFFNDADIAVVWKSFYESGENTATMAEQFLSQTK